MKIQLSEHFTYCKLLRFTLPSIAMMLVSSLYSVVDGLFVSNFLGKTSFAAVNLIMPFLGVFSAFGMMIGAGGTALVSKTLGMGDRKRANELFSLLMAFCLVGGVVLTVLSIILMRPVAIALGGQGQVLEDAVVYGIIVQLGLIGYYMEFSFQSFCAAAEKPSLPLIMSVVSGVGNIVLDALFVVVFQWGIIGAAAATAISNSIGPMIPLIYFLRPNDSLLRFTKFKLDVKALVRVCTNGASELMGTLSSSVSGMLYNLQLLQYAGENGLAAHGVMMYVNHIFAAVYSGFALGSAPLIGFNYGADNHRELKNLFRKSLVILGGIGLGMLLSAELLSAPLACIFVGYDESLMKMTARGLAVYAPAFLLCGFNVFGSSMFTALSNGLVSGCISFFRTLICQVAAILLLPPLLDLDGVWVASAVAELCALGLVAFCFMRYRRKYHYG